MALAVALHRGVAAVCQVPTSLGGLLDTLFGRSGRKVFGAHFLHDGAQPEGSGQRTRWGNCWVVVVLVVELPCLGARQVGLPILFRLFRPKDDARPELDRDRPSQPELARLLIDMVLKRFPTRVVQPPSATQT